MLGYGVDLTVHEIASRLVNRHGHRADVWTPTSDGTYAGAPYRLREIIDDPAANLGCVAVDEGGRTGRLFTSPRKLFARLTSEFNSHLAVHHDQVVRSGTNFHAVVHAQPRHLTYLSHIPRYQYEPYLNRHLLRWQPETIINLPEGIDRPKMGFGVPVGKWFRGEMRSFVSDILLSDKALNRGIIRPEVLRRYVSQHTSGERDHQFQLWTLLMLELWFQRFID